MVRLKVQYLLQSNPNQLHNLPPFSTSFAKFTMDLDGARSLGMPKSSSERSSKSEFSDSEFVFCGGLKLMVVLTWEMGVERGMGIGGR